MPTDALINNSLTDGLTLPQQQAKVQAGVLEDMEAVMAAYQQRIFRFHLMSIRDRDLAETLTQDTFLRAWTARHSFRGDCAVLTWLMRIALNLVRDHTRTDRFRFWKRVSDTAVDVSDVAAHIPHRESTLESRLIASEQMTLVWESVATLSERQRSIFILRFVDELELAEIAEIVDIPISTVKTHLYRALASIRARHDSKRKESL
jgi:RNA polymerase sigma-70 factor (ECF subfamily)